MSASNFSKNSLLFILILSFLLSCSKFEDGPAISFLSVKNRIAQSWKVEYILNLSTGISHSADFEGWLFTLEKDGSFVKTVLYNQLETIYNGSWELTQKNIIRLEYTTLSGTVVEFYTILRLTKNEFWIKDQFQEIHYYN